jgi:hypothetical protein
MLEAAVQVDRQAVPPVGVAHVLQKADGPADPGVVDQHVEATLGRQHGLEEACHLGLVADVGPDPLERRVAGGQLGQRHFVHVADMDPGAQAREARRDRPSDVPPAGGDQDPLAFNALHGAPLPKPNRDPNTTPQ